MCLVRFWNTLNYYLGIYLEGLRNSRNIGSKYQDSLPNSELGMSLVRTKIITVCLNVCGIVVSKQH